MVGLTTLWLPILLSAVVVFVASSLVHMALKYHKNDYAKLQNEDAVVEALRRNNVGPGDYMFPHCGEQANMKNPEMQKKFEKGPIGLLYVRPNGMPNMGKHLTLWLLYTLAVGVFIAYVTGRTLAPGTDYLHVFRVAGTVGFLTYAGAEPVSSIWKGVRWSTTVKNMFDGLLYGLLSAGVFGWLWPR